MGYIAFASAKGSPGVTTAIAALAATWPAERPLVVVELDPAGGDLVVRFDLATEPGLVTLAAAGRRELGPETLLAHTQPVAALSGDGRPPRQVLVAPVSADQATASLSALRGGLVGVLDRIDADVLVDCGRLDPLSPAHDVATGAELLVAVARPVVTEVHHLAARLASLTAGALSLLTVGDRPYSPAEVADTVGASSLGSLPVDHRAAHILAGGHPDAIRKLRRSPLLRDARSVAGGMVGWLAPGAEALSAGEDVPTPPTPPPMPRSAPRLEAGPTRRGAASPPLRSDLPPPPGVPPRPTSPAPGPAAADDFWADPPVPVPTTAPPSRADLPPPGTPPSRSDLSPPQPPGVSGHPDPQAMPGRLRVNGWWRDRGDGVVPKYFPRGDVEAEEHRQ